MKIIHLLAELIRSRTNYFSSQASYFEILRETEKKKLNKGSGQYIEDTEGQVPYGEILSHLEKEANAE